ncbi:MAG: class I tRNA ligase family protein, partial [Candidatus Nanohaloarchaea archaeon]|nr:class I tRNA ligase family protein [Candidatus Nanohaloarchaea archaeon]
PEDYEVVKEYDIPVFSPLDEEGCYTEEGGTYEGQNVYDANPDIVDDLDAHGYLFHAEKVSHEYPHCWRCKSRIIYRAARQWFLEIDPIKDTMIEENREVEWYPETAGSKRFHNWLEGAHDWCISRQNYWGVPVPVWECTDCDEREVVGSFAQLEDRAGELPEDFDPHKHVVDDIDWACDCGGTMERVPDIIDVWADSGCAPFASLHYPFEEEEFERKHPMNFIVEGSDQIRGWFYSLMFCSATLFDEAPYEQVLLQAFVLDEEGEKMSKSLGNVVDPQDVMDDLGADVPRFWVMENSKQWENAKVSMDEIREETRPVLNTYWNTAQFLSNYATGEVERPDDLETEDEWLLSRLHGLLHPAADLYDTCHYHEFCREFEEFVVEDLSRWYVKLVRDRVKDGDAAAVWTLRHALEQVTLAVAPITPHLTEDVYQDLFGDEASVHMEAFPDGDRDEVDREMEAQMETVRDLVDTVNAVRDSEGMNLRWPAKKIVLSVTEEAKQAVERFEHVVKDRANVKEVEFGSVETKLVAEPNYEEIGPRFGEDADAVARYITEMEPEQIEQLQATGEIWLDDHQVREEDVTVRKEAAGHVAGSEFAGGEVYLDTEMTPELENEALVRELIRNVQEARKEAGLDVEDDIDLHLWGHDQVAEAWQDEIEQQVNIRDLVIGEEGGEERGTASFKEYEIAFGFTEV